MVKPIGPICNLACSYCFYLEKDKLYPDDRHWAMSEEVLEGFVRDYIAAQDVPEITFAWQGGEPTLLGVDFFEKAVAFQEQYADGKRIMNAFQTNGTLLDDAWGAFLAKHDFLIGLSIDGPQSLHDRYRRDKENGPSFERVKAGMDMLKKHGVEFNTLSCVHRHNADSALEVYRFLREEGSGFMQFIPIIERAAVSPGEDGLTLVTPDNADAAVTPWSVRPKQYGKFLSTIFDEWVRNDVGQVFVQIFDVALQAWFGMEPGLCVFQETCGEGLALEHNGDLYSCDHYVYPEYLLGNIAETPMRDLVYSDFQKQFGADKREKLPESCRQCDVHFMCHGECPKHRFIKTRAGEAHLNYLCEGYKHLFHHIDPYMRFMANELRYQRPPANVMDWIRQEEAQAQGKTAPAPNDPCSCGSGKKFKKCCGRLG